LAANLGKYSILSVPHIVSIIDMYSGKGHLDGSGAVGWVNARRLIPKKIYGAREYSLVWSMQKAPGDDHLYLRRRRAGKLANSHIAREGVTVVSLHIPRQSGSGTSLDISRSHVV